MRPFARADRMYSINHEISFCSEVGKQRYNNETTSLIFTSDLIFATVEYDYKTNALL